MKEIILKGSNIMVSTYWRHNPDKKLLRQISAVGKVKKQKK